MYAKNIALSILRKSKPFACPMRCKGLLSLNKNPPWNRIHNGGCRVYL